MSTGSFEFHSSTLPYVSPDFANVYLVSHTQNSSKSFPLRFECRCRGLKVLVDLLDEDYVEQRDLVVHAVNGIGSVFELQSPTTKNDFCRMFIREGLLNPLSTALVSIIVADPISSGEMKAKIVQILLVFCQVSHSDVHVRNALGTRMVVRRKAYTFPFWIND